MRTKGMLLLALLGALGRVSAMAPTNVYSLNSGDSRTSVPTMPAVAPFDAEFHEVYQILSTNLEGVTANELDHAAVVGLVHELGPRVGLVTAGAENSAISALAEARVFDNAFAYFRVASVTSTLPDAFRTAYKQMTETNKSKIKGLVLDLRFADGFDYAAAAKLADCFLSSEHPLLDWQSGSAHATLKSDAITIPVTILINSQTVGAAEALAAALRDTDVGLVLGSQTAGQANIFKEFPLYDGSKLRVAVGHVSFGSGKPLTNGLVPDIAIETSLEDQRSYLQDPYKVLHPPLLSKTENAKAMLDQPRMNEVELIREHNSGEDRSGADVRLSDAPATTPAVADPALARALDLLKGLAVVQPNRSG
jgi:Peptidase family S41